MLANKEYEWIYKPFRSHHLHLQVSLHSPHRDLLRLQNIRMRKMQIWCIRNQVSVNLSVRWLRPCTGKMAVVFQYPCSRAIKPDNHRQNDQVGLYARDSSFHSLLRSDAAPPLHADSLGSFLENHHPRALAVGTPLRIRHIRGLGRMVAVSLCMSCPDHTSLSRTHRVEWRLQEKHTLLTEGSDECTARHVDHICIV